MVSRAAQTKPVAQRKGGWRILRQAVSKGHLAPSPPLHPGFSLHPNRHASTFFIIPQWPLHAGPDAGKSRARAGTGSANATYLAMKAYRKDCCC